MDLENRKTESYPWISLLVMFLTGLLAVILLFYFDIREVSDPTTKEILYSLSNHLFTVAILLLGFGAMIFISEAGNFYALQYIVYVGSRKFIPLLKADLNEKDMDYFDFKTKKEAEQRSKGNKYRKFNMLFVGAFYFLADMIVLYIYYQM